MRSTSHIIFFCNILNSVSRFIDHLATDFKNKKTTKRRISPKYFCFLSIGRNKIVHHKPKNILDEVLVFLVFVKIRSH